MPDHTGIAVRCWDMTMIFETKPNDIAPPAIHNSKRRGVSIRSLRNAMRLQRPHRAGVMAARAVAGAMSDPLLTLLPDDDASCGRWYSCTRQSDDEDATSWS